MTPLQDLRNAVASDDTVRVQEALERLARHYFENSMRRIYGSGWEKPREKPCGCRIVHTCNKIT